MNKNIVFIICAQLRKDNIATFGNDLIETPNIDLDVCSIEYRTDDPDENINLANNSENKGIISKLESKMFLNMLQTKSKSSK